MGLGKGEIIPMLFETIPKYKENEKNIHNELMRFTFTERWHWTPEYIESMDELTKMRYWVMLTGVFKGEKERREKNG